MLRIVLVDDENTALKGICYILKKFCPQYQVVGAFEDGWEALDCIQKNEVDVVWHNAILINHHIAVNRT